MIHRAIRAGKRTEWWKAALLASGFGWTYPLLAQSVTPMLPPVPVEAKAAAPYTGGEPMPIDLTTALQLANASNPTIGLAQAQVREAYARLQQANVLWLPNLTAGTTYLRHDGQIQNARGDVFTTSRSSIFVGGGPQLRVETSNALFLPLVARRLTEAQAANARAITNDVQLDVALTYLELLQVYGRIAINADTLARAEQMLDRAEAADQAGLSKTRADVDRAATEVNLRRQERISLRGQAARVSARLTQLLLLQPTVDLQPAEPTVLPITLVSPTYSLDELLGMAYQNRPELASNRALREAAQVRVRQARADPLVPKLQADYIGGGFGGGRNDDVQNFNGRGDATLSAYWELQNLGFGYRAKVRERRAEADQANFRLIETQAQVAAEVTEAAKLSGYRFETLGVSQAAVERAVEMYRKLLATSFGMAGPQRQYDALEPLTAIQALNQARVQYLGEVIGFNRAQFQLYYALGQPPLCALPGASQPLAVPVVPASPER